MHASDARFTVINVSVSVDGRVNWILVPTVDQVIDLRRKHRASGVDLLRNVVCGSFRRRRGNDGANHQYYASGSPDSHNIGERQDEGNATIAVLLHHC